MYMPSRAAHTWHLLVKIYICNSQLTCLAFDEGADK